MFQVEGGIDLRKNNTAMQRLKDEAEKAKKELSTVTEYEVNIPFITADADGPKHFGNELGSLKLKIWIGSIGINLLLVERALKLA